MKDKMAVLFGFVVVSILSLSVSAQAAQEYKVVSTFGSTRTVYMSPDGLKDKRYVSGVLGKLVDRTKNNIIWFYDNEAETPANVPMSDKNILHWKAQYNLNIADKLERFSFIEVTDAAAQPPKTREVESDIRPAVQA